MALTDGCVAWYNFDVVDGTDSSGNGNTLNGTGAAFTAGAFGKIGKALTVSGSANATLTAGTANLSFGTGALSISFWVSLVGLGAGTIEGFINKGFGTSDREYQIWHGTNIAVRFYSTNASNYISATTSTAPLVAGAANVWHHIVITKPATTAHEDIKIYWDSVLQTKTSSSAGNYIGMTTSTGVLHIGGTITPSTQRSNGVYDLVGFWNRELSQDEINQLNNSNAGLDIFAPGAGGNKGRAYRMFF